VSQTYDDILAERDRLEQIVVFLEKRLEKYIELHDKIKNFTEMHHLDKVWAFDQIVLELKIRE